MIFCAFRYMEQFFFHVNLIFFFIILNVFLSITRSELPLFQYPSRSYRGGGDNSLHRREHHHRHHHSSHRHGEDPSGKLVGGNTQFIHGQSDSDSTIHSRKSIKSEERMKQKRLGLVLLLLIGALLIAFGIGLLIYFLLMESK